ncbi:Isoquinoline 1-oxidoreductase subunit [Solimonas marina]|nr:Isoquinoline 1-oxidoreductase subunit [Solimonas marina]
MRLIRLAMLVGVLAAGGSAARAAEPLKSPADFAGIADRGARSQALFTEAGKVITSPRCLNCHPVGDSPTQGDDLHAHLPHVVRGADGHGAVGLACQTCHQADNFASSGVPGNPHWGLAPRSMAWQHHTLGQICRQIKDKSRNGGRSLVQLHTHMADDALVGWAWHPGIDSHGQPRTPAPGTQQQFGELIEAWIQTGAVCPAS